MVGINVALLPLHRRKTARHSPSWREYERWPLARRALLRLGYFWVRKVGLTSQLLPMGAQRSLRYYLFANVGDGKESARKGRSSIKG